MKISVAGEELELLAERAVYWRRRETLFVADTHWGKGATMRMHAIPVPAGTTEDDLDRLSRAVEKTGCRRLVLLGDAIHAREGRQALGAVAEWRERNRTLEILLVRGNHDRRAGDPPEELRIECADAPVAEAPFVFLHHPEPSPAGYALAGHTHPSVRLRGRGWQRANLPCFWFTPSVATLPAFGSFTGRFTVRPAPEDRVYVIAEDEVLPVSGPADPGGSA